MTEEKPKARSNQHKEPAPAFMSNIFAALDIYVTKMLVSPDTVLSAELFVALLETNSSV